ncbi:MAG: hypothetical protein D6780_07320 [Candidatus Dadabacteria bacterium]|nr:MAG: hypothetical protein D6780_07320 [Candidatus Dadabacteria bacterium]
MGKLPHIDGKVTKTDLPFKRRGALRADAKAAANAAEQVGFYESELLKVLSTPAKEVTLDIKGKKVRMSKEAAISYLEEKYKSAQRLFAMVTELLAAAHDLMMRIINNIRGR